MSLRVWRAAFMMRLKNMVQYRTAAWAGVATQFFWGFMFCMIYMAFYRSNPQNAGIELSQLIDYVWLRQAFLALVMNYMRDQELGEMITKGHVGYELVRPVDLYGMWYVRILGQRLASAALRCMPILIVAMLLPEPYRLHLPPTPASGLMFIVIMTLGVLLITALTMIVYASMFKTQSSSGSMGVYSALAEFLSGNILPVVLMPVWAQSLCRMLPFMYTGDVAFRIYSGNIPVPEAFGVIGIQLLWLLVIVALGRWWLGSQLKHVVVQGG